MVNCLALACFITDLAGLHVVLDGSETSEIMLSTYRLSFISIANGDLNLSR